MLIAGVDPVSVSQYISPGDVIVIIIAFASLGLFNKYVSKPRWKDVMSSQATLTKAITDRLNHIDSDLDARPKPQDVLTYGKHAQICHDAQQEIKELILENRDIVTKEVADLKEIVVLKIKNELLEAIQRNGKK